MSGPDITPNYRVGAYYSTGAIIVTALALGGWPWTLLLLWPAASCAMAAAGYFGLGPGIYAKRGGRLGIGGRLAMAPVLFGHTLSLMHYRREGHAWDQVVPELIMGRILTDDEAGRLVQCGVTAVLDLTAEFSEAGPLRRLSYLNLPVLDLTAPTAVQLRRGVDFIRQNAANGVVYVHCKIGYSRTACVVGAYLMAAGHVATATEAIAQMRATRSPIVIRPEIISALQAFDAVNRATLTAGRTNMVETSN